MDFTADFGLKVSQVTAGFGYGEGYYVTKSCSVSVWRTMLYHQEKVEFVEVMEEVWEVMEEGPGLEDNIASGTKKQVFRKKEHKPWDQELQVQKCSLN